MRSVLKMLAVLALACAPFACSSAASDGAASTSEGATRSCNPSHRHPICPPEGDPRWCDCVLPTTCLDTGCLGADAPVCDPSTGQCVGCVTDGDCGPNDAGPVQMYCHPQTKTCGECTSDVQCNHGTGSSGGDPISVCMQKGTTHLCGCSHDWNCTWNPVGTACVDQTCG